MKPGRAEKGGHGGSVKHSKLGASLSLDKFATAKVSKYDKKQLLEKQRALRAKQINKYRKLQKRLAAEGKLPAAAADMVQDDPVEPLHASTSRTANMQESSDGAVQKHWPTAHHGADARSAKKRCVQPSAGAHEDEHPSHGSLKAERSFSKQHKQLPKPHQQQQQEQQQEQEQQQQQQQADGDEEAGKRAARQGRRKHKLPRPPSQLQRLADKREHELAEQRQAQEQRLKAQEELKQHKQAKQKERSASKHNYFKRTKHGQPVMKYRVDKVLQVLQKEIAAKP